MRQKTRQRRKQARRRQERRRQEQPQQGVPQQTLAALRRERRALWRQQRQAEQALEQQTRMAVEVRVMLGEVHGAVRTLALFMGGALASYEELERVPDGEPMH